MKKYLFFLILIWNSSYSQVDSVSNPFFSNCLVDTSLIESFLERIDSVYLSEGVPHDHFGLGSETDSALMKVISSEMGIEFSDKIRCYSTLFFRFITKKLYDHPFSVTIWDFSKNSEAIKDIVSATEKHLLPSDRKIVLKNNIDLYWTWIVTENIMILIDFNTPLISKKYKKVFAEKMASAFFKNEEQVRIIQFYGGLD